MYLDYKNVPYEKIVYNKKNPEKWLTEDKISLGIDFPNVPYLIDGEVKLSQANSILKYLELRFGSFYTGEIGHDIKLDSVLATIADFLEFFRMICYQEGEKAAKKEKYATPAVISKLEYFNDWFHKWKYLTGDSLCVADFALWTLLDYHDLFDSSILENYGDIKRFMKDFESEPRIDAYLKNPNYKKFPIF